MEEFCGSPLWNSSLTWITEDPQFTHCFLQTVLVWTPCFYFWLLSLLEIYRIKRSRSRNIPWTILNVTRGIVKGAIIALTIVDLVMAVDMRDTQDLSSVHIVTPIIKLVTMIFITVISNLHRLNGIRSSGVMFLFWFFLWLLAIPQFWQEIRYYSDRNDLIGDSENITWPDFQFISYMIYFGLVSIHLLLECFADKEPAFSEHKKRLQPSPELSASYLQRLTFSWFDSMAWTGNKRPLMDKDIWDINPDDTSEALVPPFDKFWNESVRKNKARKTNKLKEDKSVPQDSRETNGSILPAMVLAFGKPFWFAGILKLCMDLLSFASPQLLRLLIGFISSDEAMWKGYVYAIALFGASLLVTFIQGQYFYKTFLVGFRIRSALISAIYRKALRVSHTSKKETTQGEIVNLMAVDAQKFFELASYLHMIWSGPLVIAIAIYFLWQILGPSVLAGVGVMILLIPLNGFIAARLRTFQVKQMKKKDERVKMMNEILNGMKVLKLYAWEPSFESNVKQVRGDEIEILKDTAYFSAGTYFVWSMAPFLVSLATFATYVLVDENNVLNAETAFVSLALFNILRFPMAMFPMLIALAMQAWVSITRINRFMNSPEIDPDNVSHNSNENAVLIQNGQFSWGGEEKTLKNMNIAIPKEALVAIVGPVGSGKSSLISAILGDTEKHGGTVNTDGTIAYVPQQAWIQNATVKDNIIFGMAVDEVFYSQVIDACALRADLDMLPGGDQTEIGEKGINLSGGQKQRISLARAVYSRADIYLFDDPLSAVDSHVGKHIFNGVIGPKSLLAGKTRILITHGISFLKSVDKIMVIKDGEITESGSYTMMIAQKGAFADFLLEHIQEMEEDAEDFKEIKQVLEEKGGSHILERAISMRSDGKGSVRSRKISVKSTTSTESERLTAQKELANKNKLIEKEESQTGSVDFDIYVKYFKSIGIKLTLFTVFMNICNQAFSVYSNVWLSAWATDEESATKPHVRDMYLGVYGALGVGQAISLFLASIVLTIGCLKAAKYFHDSMLSKSMRLPMSFFDTNGLGRIMNRFSKDVDTLDNVLPATIRTWLMMFFGVVSIFVVISISTPIFMTVIIPIGFIYYFIQRFYVSTSRQLKRIESVTRSPIYSHFGETISGQSTIRAYRKQDRFTLESETRVDYNQKCTYPSIIANRWLAVRLEAVGSCVILASAIFAVLGRETINPALVGLSITYALQITQTLSFLVRMAAEVETNIVAVERVQEYTVIPQEAAWKKGEIDPKWPQSGAVVFDNFKVRYRDGLDLVLKGLSFSVAGGEKVGIVGRTGAGKSSLTLALFRILEAAEGRILIDGQDIAELGLHNLRSRLTIIPQDPILFSGTLRMNIDPFNAYDDQNVWTVLEHSHLKAFVKTLSSGLNHQISEGGDNLSVGQRQLICLARALLRKSKILILDEATAAVDLETDDLIQKTIRHEFRDCTVLTIAHRLNTIMDSDRVIVLDRGLVAEIDSPTNLLADTSSIFYGMAKNSGLTSDNNVQTTRI